MAAASIALALVAAPSGDRVHVLPGFGPPPTPTYAGFLNADAAEPGTRLHYHLATAEHPTAATAVVLWLNGGPGSSSYLGLLQELGPVLINATGGLFRNPYAWTRVAHLLVIESPAGVGYSYCAAQLTGGDCANSDKSSARALGAAIVDFFTAKFPALRGARLFITGESYAGVYVPTVASELLGAGAPVKLAGLAVGDPCTDNEAQAESMDMVWYAHKYGLLTDKDYELLTTHCQVAYPRDLARGRWGKGAPTWRFLGPATPRAECVAAQRRFLAGSSRAFSQVWRRAFLNDLSLYGPAARVAFDEPQSLDGQTRAWMNREDVRRALHVEGAPAPSWPGPSANWSYASDYAACNAAAAEGAPSMVDLYRTLAPRLQTTWLFNGDTDPCVSYEGTRAAADKVGFAVTAAYRPWFFNASAATASVLLEKPVLFGPSLAAQSSGVQYGGSIVNYAHNFAFLTVHGAGHMVPQFRPRAALHLLTKLVTGGALSPPYPAWDGVDDARFDDLLDRWVDTARAAPYVH